MRMRTGEEKKEEKIQVKGNSQEKKKDATENTTKGSKRTPERHTKERKQII